MNLKRQLRILHLEEQAGDSEQVAEVFASAGIDCALWRVATRDTFASALDEDGFDLIFAENNMRSFDGMSALSLAKSRQPDIPFIFVSSTLGEEFVIECLRNGATDYVLKQNLARIVPVAERALHEAAVRLEQKKANEVLLESEVTLRSLFAAITDVILVLDRDGRYLQIAPTTPPPLYKPLDSLLGHTVHQVLPEADADYILHNIQLALEKQEPIYVNYSLITDGVPVWFDGTVSPMGKDKVFWIDRDITERKRVEDKLAAFAIQLQRSNRELEEFAAVASHDLQEPLRKIQAFGNRLAVKCVDILDEDSRDYLNRMLNSATRMRILIDDLLDYSRLTIKSRNCVKVSLGEICADVLSDLSQQLERVGGRVEVGKLPIIEADGMQMRRLLQNLITNGLKFSRSGVPPVITVTSRLRKPVTEPFSPDRSAAVELWDIIVKDNGIGFDQKYVDRIFAPFQRLHGRNEFEGTGMGLAICRKIAESHWGSITAESAVGEGASFIVTLPSVQSIALPTALDIAQVQQGVTF